jgi:hypothetical protein
MNRFRSFPWVLGTSLAGLAATFVACSASPEDSSNDGTTSSTSASAGGAGGGGATTTVAQGTGGGFTTGMGGQGGEGGIIECESVTAEGEKVPLDVVIVQDRSGSMVGAKWESAVDSIKAFADNAGAAGLAVGLTYFPPIIGSECSVSVYANLDVDIALLPGNAYAIKESLLTTSPSGGTPMRPALEGGVEAMTDWLALNPTHEGIVILVTDGDPGGCSPNTISDVANIAEGAFLGTPSIRTFVVGMPGATFSNLDQVAAAGGTSSAFDVSSGTTAFVAALDEIRQQALSCEYILPVPDPSEGTLDFDSVGVDYTPGINENPESIPKVASQGDCGEISGGWYYDDPADPTRIILCPASCDLVQSGTDNAKVEVILGCIIPPPQ